MKVSRLEEVFVSFHRMFGEGVWVPIRPLTFVVGPNCSGKSTLLKGIAAISRIVGDERIGLPFRRFDDDLGMGSPVQEAAPGERLRLGLVARKGVNAALFVGNFPGVEDDLVGLPHITVASSRCDLTVEWNREAGLGLWSSDVRGEPARPVCDVVDGAVFEAAASVRYLPVGRPGSIREGCSVDVGNAYTLLAEGEEYRAPVNELIRRGGLGFSVEWGGGDLVLRMDSSGRAFPIGMCRSLNQLLPVLTYLAQDGGVCPSTLLVEQLDLFLRPDTQFKLADVLVSGVLGGHTVVAELSSVAMLSQVERLISDGVLPRELVQVLCIDGPLDPLGSSSGTSGTSVVACRANERGLIHFLNQGGSF